MDKIISTNTKRTLVSDGKILLFSLTGLIIFTSGVVNIISSKWGIALVLGTFMAVAGIGYLIFGLILISRNSKYSLRVKVNERLIELKNGFFKPTTRINWKDVKVIYLSSYQVNFELEDRVVHFPYKTHPGLSIRIKDMLREVAEEKNIKVVGE